MSTRIVNKADVELLIPDLTSSEQAMTWGLTLTDDQRELLMETFAAASQSAMHQFERGRIQAAASLTSTALLWLEAAQTRPPVLQPEDVTP
jgi:hypothetical protein